MKCVYISLLLLNCLSLEAGTPGSLLFSRWNLNFIYIHFKIYFRAKKKTTTSKRTRHICCQLKASYQRGPTLVAYNPLWPACCCVFHTPLAKVSWEQSEKRAVPQAGYHVFLYFAAQF